MKIKVKIRQVIFGTDTFAGKTFDIVLIVIIIFSISVVMFDSFPVEHRIWGRQISQLEWFFTIFFTAEYLLRVIISEKRLRYIFSFYGIIDLLSILPSFFALISGDSVYFVTLRALRLLRIFRILKLLQFINQADKISYALKAARTKIFVFMFAVLNIVLILGTLIYVIEGEANGFTSIPHSIYWAIVTITTVGYGDIAPKTALGQILASVIMLIGYSIIAVPTGLVTAEITAQKKKLITRSCPQCSCNHHIENACFCAQCGSELSCIES